MESIIKEISLRLNIPRVDVERVINSQFKLIRDIISEGEFKSYRAINLGIFAVKPNRLKNYKNVKTK
jgi:nucleoid DNA-binding protein